MKKEINKRGFASDNNAPVHHLILDEMRSVNYGHTVGYGSDSYTREAHDIFRQQLGEQCETFFVFIGTAANVLSLTAVTEPWNSVITASTAHIEQDECGAPERFSGCKVLTVETPDGKINIDMVRRHMHGIGFEHHSQPRVISITQSTEMGTIYSIEEIKALSVYAHSNDMLLHLDGARIANAAATLGVSFKEMTTDAGVDILSFGGTKNGMMYGEAICFLTPGLSKNFKYIRKQGMQLASKMRYISAQYKAYFRDDLWLELARHANSMAKELYNLTRNIDGIRFTQPVESNALFVILPPDIAEKLRKEYFFYPWNEETSEYRWMTSWDTTSEDVKTFALLVKELMSGSHGNKK